jgi:hypothetical protein
MRMEFVSFEEFVAHTREQSGLHEDQSGRELVDGRS